MNDRASAGLLDGVRDWLDPARVTHLRGCYWIAIFEDRIRRRAWWKRALSVGYRPSLGEQAIPLTVLPWMIGVCAGVSLLGVALLFLVGSFGRLTTRAMEGSRLPWRMVEVLSINTPRVDVARDLWLAGLTGREAAIAIYGDLRRGHLALVSFVMLIQFLLVLLMSLHFFMRGIASEVLALMMAPELSRVLAEGLLLYMVLGWATANLGLRAYIMEWRGAAEGVVAQLRPALFVLLALLLVPTLSWLTKMVCFLLADLIGVPEVRTAFPYHRVAHEDALQTHGLIAVVMLLVYTAPLLLLACLIRKNHTTGLEEELADADRAFHQWIHRQHEGASGA